MRRLLARPLAGCLLWLALLPAWPATGLASDLDTVLAQVIPGVRADIKLIRYDLAGPPCPQKALVAAHNSLLAKWSGDAVTAVASAVFDGVTEVFDLTGVPSTVENGFKVTRCAALSGSAVEFAECLRQELGLTLPGEALYASYQGLREALVDAPAERTEWTNNDGEIEIHGAATWLKDPSLPGAGSAGKLIFNFRMRGPCRRGGDLVWAFVSFEVAVDLEVQANGRGVFTARKPAKYRVEAECCGEGSRHTIAWDPSGRVVPFDDAEPSPAPDTGAGTEPPVSTPPPAPQPAVPQPVPPSPAPPPRKVWTVDDPCPECQHLKDAVDALQEEAAADGRAVADGQAAIDAQRAELEEMQARARGMQSQLDRGTGDTAESYDPKTGITTRAEDTGDGMLTITTTGPDGATTTRRIAKRSTDDLRAEKAALDADIAARGAVLDAALEAQRARAQALAEKQAELERRRTALRDCIERCNDPRAERRVVLLYSETFDASPSGDIFDPERVDPVAGTGGGLFDSGVPGQEPGDGPGDGGNGTPGGNGFPQHPFVANASPPTFQGDNGCNLGFGPFTLTLLGVDRIEIDPFGSNGTTTFTVNGNFALADNPNLQINGNPGFQCVANHVDPDLFQVFCDDGAPPQPDCGANFAR